jgi:integrase
MGRKSLTVRFVESVKVDVRTDFWDDGMRGLVLRVSPSGVKSWTAVYTRQSDGKKRRLTLGTFPTLSLEQARARALGALKAISDGEDPAKAKQDRRSALTTQKLGERFIADYAKGQKRTWAEDERILKREVYPYIGGYRAQDLTRRDVLDITDAKKAAGAPVQADRILAVVRKMYNWAAEVEHLKENPLAGIRRVSKPIQRDRVLTVKEVRDICRAMHERPLPTLAGEILLLMFLTGQRSGEVAGMRLGEIRLANRSWVIPKERSKNKRPHLVPLSDAALVAIQPRIEALEAEGAGADAPIFTRGSEPVDSRWVAKMVRTHLAKGFDHWTPHDVRRTVATMMGDIGILPHVVEATLNHVSGFRSGVAGTYNLAEYANEKRDALERWADRFAEMAEGRRDAQAVVRLIQMPKNS